MRGWVHRVTLFDIDGKSINTTKPTPERTPAMPCRSDYMEPTPAETTAAHNAAMDSIRIELDRLTRENDELREMILRLNGGGQLTEGEAMRVGLEQVDHRKADLARLEKTFIQAQDIARLEKVWNADPAFPLAPQLGFNPDDY